MCRTVYQPGLEHGDLALGCVPLGTQGLSFHSRGQSAKRQTVPVTEHTGAPSVRRRQEQNLQSLLIQFLKQDCCWWGGNFLTQGLEHLTSQSFLCVPLRNIGLPYDPSTDLHKAAQVTIKSHVVNQMMLFKSQRLCSSLAKYLQ